MYGFNLIELMVAIAIFGIIMTIGFPGLQTTVMNNRLVSQTNALVTALHHARSEAIKLNTRVALCHSDNGASCSEGPDTVSGWENGWLLLAVPDPDADITSPFTVGNDCGLDEDENCLLTIQDAIGTANFVIGAEAIPDGQGVYQVAYRGDGTIQTNRGTDRMAFVLCDARGGPGRQINISNTGRPSVQLLDVCINSSDDDDDD